MALDNEIEVLSLVFMWVFCGVFCVANYLSYRRTGYRYLLLAVATLLVELVRLTANDLTIHRPLPIFYLLSSVAFFVEALLCLATIRTAADRPLPLRTVALALAFYLVDTALTSNLDAHLRWAWYLKYMPVLVVHAVIIYEAWRLYRQRWQASGWLLAATISVMVTRLALPWLSVNANLIYGFAYFTDGLLFSLTMGTVMLIALEQLSAEKSQNLEQRHQVESTLRFLLDNSADVIISHGDDGRMLSWNNRARQVFGYLEQDVVGKLHIDQLIVPSSDGAETRRETTAFASDGRRFQVEVAHRYGVDNNRVYHTLVIRDLTTVREIEERQEQLSDQLREVQKLESLGALAAGVAHDFNNLLASMMGHAELAAKQLSTPTQARESIAQILVATHRASELTGQLLTYAGKAEFNPGFMDLNVTIEEIVGLMRASIRSRARFDLDLAPGGAWISADRAQVTQILINLVSNASDALPSDDGIIHIRTARDRDAGTHANPMSLGHCQQGVEYILMQVSDNGNGMSEAVRSRVFEPFYSTKFTGRGLGLAAVAGIVKKHQGAVHLESAPGEGTRFSFYFPASETKTNRTPAPVTADYEPVTSGLSILVVDDKVEIVDLCQSILAAAGHRVTRAICGDDAIMVAGNDSSIDLLVMDYDLPDVNGVEIYLTLAARNLVLPVVFVTGANVTPLRASLDPAWPATILKKPFMADELLEAVDFVSDGEIRGKVLAHR